MTRREESVTFGSSGDEPSLCPRLGTRVFSSLWFALPCSPLLPAPWPHADPSPSPANRGRCQVSSLWRAEQHPHTPPTTRGKASPASLQKPISGTFSCACFRNDMTYFPSIPSQTWITTTGKTTHPKIQALLCPAVKMLQVPHWDQRCPAWLPNPAPGILTWARVWWSSPCEDTSTCCRRNTSPNLGASWNRGVTSLEVLLLLPSNAIKQHRRAFCEDQRVHQQPEQSGCMSLPADACPCTVTSPHGDLGTKQPPSCGKASSDSFPKYGHVVLIKSPPKLQLGFQEFEFPLCLPDLCCLEGWQGCGKAAAPL